MIATLEALALRNLRRGSFMARKVARLIRWNDFRWRIWNSVERSACMLSNGQNKSTNPADQYPNRNENPTDERQKKRTGQHCSSTQNTSPRLCLVARRWQSQTNTEG